eukprot:TRINITY_DN34511_c0_g1_i1.p1 TRINITY_DN34511_c0_g1~~TRINITY_DN34511_c0_g1_i1.p1  ORF type:complete len:515 (+),score=80.66 TRINITY_DN34511_c0_g1_i1:72-1616(+)
MTWTEEPFELQPLDLGAPLIIPVIPEAARLRAATDNAFVALPDVCARRCGLPSNFEENDGLGPRHWLGRADALNTAGASGRHRWRLGSSNSTQQGRCVRQCRLTWVLLCHGSGGLTYTAWRWAAKLVALGYGVLAPDSFAAPRELSLRHRDGLQDSEVSFAGQYWAGDPLYSSSCSWHTEGGKYPFCYSTEVKNFVSNPVGWQEFYRRVQLLRRRELDWLVEHLPTFLGRADLFMLGHSEGGMLAAHYFHPKLEARLKGRIISAWSCEHNYFVSHEGGSQICEGRCERSTPMLNIIGSEDQYFSAKNFSVAARVAKSISGFGTKAIEGHCREAFRAGTFQAATLLLKGAAHDTSLTHDDATRSFLSEFLSSPKDFVQGDAQSLRLLCQGKTSKPTLYECAEDGENESLTETESGLAHTVYHFPAVRLKMPTHQAAAPALAFTAEVFPSPHEPDVNWQEVDTLRWVVFALLSTAAVLAAPRWRHGLRASRRVRPCLLLCTLFALCLHPNSFLTIR